VSVPIEKFGVTEIAVVPTGTVKLNVPSACFAALLVTLAVPFLIEMETVFAVVR
jgi:hypothetical protein